MPRSLPRSKRTLCKAEEVDREFAQLQVWMGTPKYKVADRLNVSVRTLNVVLKQRRAK
jgi:hypothetical protein